jgi:hypothetical protein
VAEMSINTTSQQTFSIDVSGLSTGIYIVNILNAHFKASEKIVIE